MTNRWPTAISLGFTVALVQIGAFVAIGYLAWQALVNPNPGRMTYALGPFSHEFCGELIIPECEMSQRGNVLQSGGALTLRAVNLITGVAREIPLPSTVVLHGMASGRDRLWVVGATEVLEFDGTKFTTIRPNRNISSPFVTPFVFEGHLATIDSDSLGINRLYVLIDGQWREQGRIALPGAGRNWVLDAVTGNMVLAPLDSSLPNGGFPARCRIQVVKHQGEYHLFHFDAAKPSFSYRAGFEFIKQPGIDEPISALLAENQVAEATGWVLLDIDSAPFSRGFPNVVDSDDGLLLCNENAIWKLPLTDVPPRQRRPEPYLHVELAEEEYLTMVTSATTETHVLACPILDDFRVLKLQNGQLQTLPYTIAGMGRPIQSWMLTTLWRILMVWSLGTLVLILAAGRMQNESDYSSGHETVRLASVVRRSLARSVDLLLLFGPLVVHALWLLWNTSFQTLVNGLEDQSGLSPLIPATLWLAGAWLALVISNWIWGSTPGKWLFGLRVVRTSLRRCSLFASLARELLFWIDTSQLLSAIPGIVCMMGTQNRQRIGDLIAGTLVIESRSNPAK